MRQFTLISNTYQAKISVHFDYKTGFSFFEEYSIWEDEFTA